MGKLDDQPFKESCCDGGATSDGNSCQPCGCDVNANWVCAFHKARGISHTEQLTPSDMEFYLDSVEPGAMVKIGETLYKHLIGRNNELAYNEAIDPIKLGLPSDDKDRKKLPLWSGVLMYFPDALLAVSEVSRIGNDQHNPGQPLHWERGKSTDQMNTAIRHMVDHGTGNRYDKDGARHLAKAAWRLLAELQLDIENEKGH